MAKSIEQLKKDIVALKEAGINATAEEAELKAAILATAPAAPAAPAKEAAPAPGLAFINLNVESFKAGWKSSGWIAPATTGVKSAICDGLIFPERVEDQVWFSFNSLEDAVEEFRGSLVCGALTAETGKSAAGKVKDVLDILGVPYEVKSNGIKLLADPKGKSCQVLWDDVSIRGKTERRIQDVLPANAEPVM